jgi:hypothetical protein
MSKITDIYTNFNPNILSTKLNYSNLNSIPNFDLLYAALNHNHDAVYS